MIELLAVLMACKLLAQKARRQWTAELHASANATAMSGRARARHWVLASNASSAFLAVAALMKNGLLN